MKVVASHWPVKYVREGGLWFVEAGALPVQICIDNIKEDVYYSNLSVNG